MKGKWHSRRDGEDGAPIELRFVDMFMAVIGSMIFIAMTFAILPKETNPFGSLDVDSFKIAEMKSKIAALESKIASDTNHIKELLVQNARLKEDSSCHDKDCVAVTQSAKEGRWFDSGVVKTWIHIAVRLSDCRLGAPEIYLRYEGKLFNTETGKPAKDTNKFDILGIVKDRTELLGDKYLDERIEPDSIEKSYYGVLASGTSILYIGLTKPSDQGDVKCVAVPQYDNYGKNILNYKYQVNLTESHPYAILGRIKVGDDSILKLDVPLDPSKLWRREMSKFSAEQSKRLCESSGLCSTSAANIVLLVPPPN